METIELDEVKRKRIIVFLFSIYDFQSRMQDPRSTYIPPTEDEAMSAYRSGYLFHQICVRFFKLLTGK
jgi:hypothetical protein